MIFQTSCSELLVDTAIHDPKVAYQRFSELFNRLGWETSPPLSIAVLRHIRSRSKRSKPQNYEVIVYDSNGNSAWIEYGGNGYITTGFRFDSHGNDWNSRYYPIFRQAIEDLEGKLISCDGGNTAGYEGWLERKTRNGKRKKNKARSS